MLGFFYTKNLLFLFVPIFLGFTSILPQVIQVYNHQIFEMNFTSLEFALNQNINLERIFVVSNSNYSTPCQIYTEKNFTNKTTIIGQNTLQIIVLYNVIKIHHSLNLTNILVSSQLNATENMFKIFTNGTFSCFKCVFTNIEGNERFFVFESFGGILFYKQCVFAEINSHNLSNIFNLSFSQIFIQETVFQSIDLHFASFISMNNSYALIFNSFFFNLTLRNSDYITLGNSELNFTNNSVINSYFYSGNFFTIHFDYGDLINTPSMFISACIIKNILISNQSFIYIDGADVLKLNVENLVFVQISLDGPLFYLKNVNITLIVDVEMWGLVSNQFLYIINSNFIKFQNIILCSTNVYLGESIIYLKNTINKIFNNLTLTNSRNLATTPGIKIIETLSNLDFKTEINNSFFSNNTINYSSNNDIGSVLYISSDSGELFIENSLFLQNNLLPVYGFSDIKIGGACVRASGKNIKLFIKNSIFNGNMAVFDSNCIQFNGNILLIINSYFLGNINFIRPWNKGVVDVFGYGGSIYAVCQNFTINNSYFEQNMNYYGGTIYYYGSPQNQMTKLLINSTIFIDNYSHSFGACLYINSQIEKMIAFFINSMVYYNWGNFNAAVFLNYDSKEAVISFENIFFIENWSDFDPVIDFECISGVSYITNCSFFNNTANWLPRNISKYFYKSNFATNCGAAGAIGVNSKAGNSALYIFSKNNIFMDNWAAFKGGVLGMIGGNFSDENSIFRRNHAKAAGTFYVHIKSFLSLTNSTIIEYDVIGSVSCILIKEFSYLHINRSVFKNIRGSGTGLISVENECECIISNSIFNNVTSSTGSILNVKFVSFYRVTVINNIFMNSLNFKSTELFYFKEATNIFLIGNLLKNTINGIFTIVESIVLSSGNYYKDVICLSPFIGCILQSSLNSSVHNENDSFSNISSIENFLFDISNSRINISHSILQLIQTLKNGGFIFHSSVSQFYSFNLSMVNFFPGGFNIEISSSFFVNVSFFMKNSSKSISFKQKEESVIKGYNLLRLLVVNCFFFSNNYSPKGGTIFLKCDNNLCFNNSIYQIQSSNFIDNKENELGGVIYCENTNLILLSNVFVNNSATQSGGVIYFNSTYKLQLMNNTFINNFGWEGGAIKYTSTPPLIWEDNIFENNNAFYGSNFASYPIRFSMIEYLNQSNQSQLTIKMRPSNLESVFQNFSMNLLDNLNQKVSTINNSFISIDLKSDVSNSFGLKGGTIIQISNGTIFINQTFFYSNLSNKHLNLQISTEVIQSAYNKNIQISQNEAIVNHQYMLIFPLKIENCSLGEYFDKNLLFCMPCPRGTFSLNLLAEKCQLCPNEADFCSDSKIFLQNGYWRSNNYSLNIYRCFPNSESCLGGYDSACEKGYAGPLCQSCEREAAMYMKMYGKCFLCLNNYTFQIIQLILGGAILIGFYIYIVRGNLKLNETFKFDENGNLDQKSSEVFYSTIYNKIIVDYFQMISFIKGIELKWTQLISIYFQIDYYLGNAAGYIFSFDCLVQNNFTVKPLYLQTILFSLLPFFSIFLLSVFWLWRLRKNANKHELFWQKYTTSELVIINILQPTIVTAMMKILTCRDIDGIYYIFNDYNYECMNNENKWYIFVISIPTLFIWIVIYQIINLVRLWKSKKLLYSEKVRKEIGFLYNFYRKKYFYWEFVEIYKKYILIFIITYLQNKVEIMSLVVLFFIFLLCLLLKYFTPYLTKEINNISLLSHMVIISTLIFGLFSFETTENVQMISNCFIFSLNTLFLIFFYIKFVLIKKARIKSYLSRIAFLRNSSLLKRERQTELTERKLFFTKTMK